MDTQGKSRHPMIVDIAIDNKGKKSYCLHGVFEEGRFSTNPSASLDHRPLSPPGNSEALTPSSSSQGTTLGNFSSGPLQCPRGLVTPCSNTSFASCSEADADIHRKYASDKAQDIWSADVQKAFEEVLAIVPKNGLNKIKIGGRSCGRNELISDYIYAKTGKFRSRKQVSSHIQVIKNMGHPHQYRLIALINDGPQFASTAEAAENNARFEKIFSKIYLSKSLGVGLPEKKRARFERLHHSHNDGIIKRAKKELLGPVAVHNVAFTVGSFATGGSSALTFHQHQPLVACLTLKDDARFDSRFPGLRYFADSDIPILHNMVRLLNPPYVCSNADDYRNLSTNFFLSIPGAESGERLCCFSSVYSLGKEILKVSDDEFAVNTNQPFLLNFWRNFFCVQNSQPTGLDAAFKGITVRQIVYEKGSSSTTKMIPKRNIRAVILWEFSVVYNWENALTTASELTLPRGVPTAPAGSDSGSPVKCESLPLLFKPMSPAWECSNDAFSDYQFAPPPPSAFGDMSHSASTISDHSCTSGAQFSFGLDPAFGFQQV